MTLAIGDQRAPLDLSACDTEPIHIPGAIQPHGVLLAIEDAGLTIVHASANCAQWLQQTPGQLIGRSLDSLLTSGSAALLRECLVECIDTTSSLRSLQFALENRNPLSFCASAHRSGDVSIIELERLPGFAAVEDQSTLALMGKCRIASRRLGNCESTEELFPLVTQELCSLIGYDRVMVYQFDEEWNGAVIAEHRLDCMEPYLGLHFPAADIPGMARELFLMNGPRVIPDVHYQPIPIFPLEHLGAVKPLNLSRSQLRSVSPVHLEYLRNMGVRATLTIPLVVDGKLWGLIACHHRAPRYLSPPLREVCELFGQMVSMRLTERVQAADNKMAQDSKEMLRRLATRVHEFGSIIPALLADQHELLALANAQGAILWRDGGALPIGAAPPPDCISALQLWVSQMTSHPVFFTDCLPKRFQAAEAYADVASGMLALVLARSPDVFLFWFRPEVIRTVEWAGDPEKSIEPDRVDGRVHPRKSFARWKKSIRHCSLPWLKDEIEAVKQLRTILQDQMVRTSEELAKLMPICAWCKRVRSDENYWQQVEQYISQHSDIRLTYGMCPDCLSQESALLG